MKCSVRLATIDDASSISAVHEVARSASYKDLMAPELLNATSRALRLADWIGQLECAANAGNQIFVAEADFRIVGFAVVGPDKGKSMQQRVAELDRIYVDPKYWGKGIGKKLVECCLSWSTAKQFHEIYLWTFAANERARRFYESVGFIAQNDKRTIGLYPEEVRYSRSVDQL